MLPLTPQKCALQDGTSLRTSAPRVPWIDVGSRHIPEVPSQLGLFSKELCWNNHNTSDTYKG